MVQTTRGKNVAQKIYDDTGVSIAAGGTYKSDAINISGLEEIKVFAELSYHASATKGGRVDVIPIQPDEATENTDVFITAVVPSFAADELKSKTGSPINIYGLRKIKLAVVNEDTVQAMILKKLYIY